MQVTTSAADNVRNRVEPNSVVQTSPDTFEEEEAVDLDEVKRNLAEIDAELKEAQISGDIVTKEDAIDFVKNYK